MKKHTNYKVFIVIFLITQYCFSQVDVVYNDLVWSDEFETIGPVNSNKWFHQTQLPNGGSWYNGEVQHYTSQTTNSYALSGFLNIVAIKENYTNQGVTKAYTSARLNSKFAFKYGRVDVRAKVPLDQGTWPAIWLLGKNVNEPGAYFAATFGNTNWPACGEIDMMEHGITQSHPVNYIQSALHTPSSSGNTSNIGGAIANNLGTDFHVYSMNWSPSQISFLLDNVVYYTYNPAVKDASTWPFDKEQYILLNIAMGGVAGTIPSSFTQAKMEIDYVRIYQNTTVDTQKPTNFTASIGSITDSSIELLLNGLDNSGTVVYNVSYGATTLSFSNVSGAQKSAIITGLVPSTNYSFSVIAADLSGNTAANNPIALTAKTLQSLSCSGTDNAAQQGTFSIGYKYDFKTIGTDVKVTFELLDTDKVGVVAYLWKESPFTETQMTNVSGNIFTQTLTGLTNGSTIKYGVKFAFAGGLAVTKYFSYVVGADCSLGIANYQELEQFYFSNPARNYVSITAKTTIDKVEIYNMQGRKVSSIIVDTNKVDVRNLPKGIYLLSVYSGNKKSIKKLIVE